MQYTPKEVFRTAFRYIENTSKESLGDNLQHGINQVCICCKAGSTTTSGTVGSVEKIIDTVELKPWSDFYTSGDNTYSAYKCLSCGYKWSWYKAVNQTKGQHE